MINMLISFSGAQSTGKTTLLNHLQNYNSDHIKFVPEVTRLIQKEYKLDINEQGNHFTQTLINAEHIKNIILNKHMPVILDRCSLDGLVYTEWMYMNNKVSAGTFLAAAETYKLTGSMYNIIFYTDPNDVEIEDDGVRSTDVQFRNDIIEIFDRYVEDNTFGKIVTLKGTVEERLQQIKNVIEAKFDIEISI